MWSQTDWNLRQIKHRLPRQTSSSPTSTFTPSSSNRRQTSTTFSRGKASTSSTKANTPTFSPFLPASNHSSSVKLETQSTTTELPVEDPMNLSSAITAVKGKSLKVPGVKKICDDYKLCYYCKQSHPGMTAKTCPNKGTALRSAQFLEIEDDQSVVGQTGQQKPGVARPTPLRLGTPLAASPPRELLFRENVHPSVGLPVRTPRDLSAAPLILASRVYDAFAGPSVPCPNLYKFKFQSFSVQFFFFKRDT